MESRVDFITCFIPNIYDRTLKICTPHQPHTSHFTAQDPRRRILWSLRIHIRIEAVWSTSYYSPMPMNNLCLLIFLRGFYVLSSIQAHQLEASWIIETVSIMESTHAKEIQETIWACRVNMYHKLDHDLSLLYSGLTLHACPLRKCREELKFSYMCTCPYSLGADPCRPSRLPNLMTSKYIPKNPCTRSNLRITEHSVKSKAFRHPVKRRLQNPAHKTDLASCASHHS